MGKDKRHFGQEFKYEAIRLMDEGKRSVRDIDPALLSFGPGTVTEFG
jgi:hypothetical protein